MLWLFNTFFFVYFMFMSLDRLRPMIQESELRRRVRLDDWDRPCYQRLFKVCHSCATLTTAQNESIVLNKLFYFQTFVIPTNHHHADHHCCRAHHQLPGYRWCHLCDHSAGCYLLRHRIRHSQLEGIGQLQRGLMGSVQMWLQQQRSR